MNQYCWSRSCRQNRPKRKCCARIVARRLAVARLRACYQSRPQSCTRHRGTSRLCPLLSESDRSAAMQRLSALCHERPKCAAATSTAIWCPSLRERRRSRTAPAKSLGPRCSIAAHDGLDPTVSSSYFAVFARVSWTDRYRRELRLP